MSENTKSLARKGRGSCSPVNPMTPKSPSVEPLTPIQLEEDAVASVVSRLHIPVLLTQLIKASNELVGSEVLGQFLSICTISQRNELRRISEKLYQSCNDFCTDDQNKADEISISQKDPLQPNTTGNDGSKAGLGEQRKANLRPSLKIALPSNDILDRAQSTIEVLPEGRRALDGNSKSLTREQRMSTISTPDTNGQSEDLDSSTESFVLCSKSNNRKSSNIQHASESSNGRNKRFRRASRGSRRPKVLPLSDSDSYNTSTVRRTSRAPSPVNNLLESSLPSPEDSPLKGCELRSQGHRTGKGDSQLLPPMATQSSAEFAMESLSEIQDFKLPDNSLDTYKAIFASLKREQQDESVWSDGSEWKGLVETAFLGRRRSSIHYALTAMALSRWYDGQARRYSLKPRAAATEVSRRLLGEPPKDSTQKIGWELRRKRLTTHLTRGRKWAKLVDSLGFGILFKDAWTLVKTDEPLLMRIIACLQMCPEKMCILQLLGEQMDLLLEHGQTRPDILEQSLEKQKLLDRRPSVKLTKIISEGITDLQARMRTTSSEGHFEIESAQFRFNSDILSGLEGSNWISHELILLCMHLADRLPHIRIGFSVPIHENIRGRERKVLRDPFERAADQIEKWNKAESEDRLVCFFPLFQNDNHFSLLEINQRDGRIYHYDSKGYKTSDIQAACKRKFPNLQYMNQKTPCQLDDFSCGPLVVSMARRRMLCQDVICGDIGEEDALQLRADALSLVTKAWLSSVIIPAQAPMGKRKRKFLTKYDGASIKRHKAILIED
ncbi:uncharacterized protein F4817DRAFT_321089 [Daldinia loculata]|uniref:uncharacterized protein n=1 Tax=Daldinia loculata TaxID=103429 RepID=UPI0020C34642|nr:uncharacterized protein F4817DRAFT_321089 [Daldinia loculata]KAI1642169.1 hypothetical protein F4817DRAFT_321089 [Daldinia loculata]